jgi:Holliday junction resolvasome RuvABC endonuclease subunit
MRWLEVRAWLLRLLESAPTDVVAYEQAHHRGGAATHVAHALIAIVEEVAAERGLELTSRHTATIKKHATGKGRCDKSVMFQLAREKWSDRTIADHNEADALWLLDLVQHDLGMEARMAGGTESS